MFGTWLSSGLDSDRLAAKLGRLLGQLTGRGSGGEHGSGGDGRRAAKDRAKARKRLLKGGVRGLFEAIDKKATGSVSRHDMKVISSPIASKQATVRSSLRTPGPDPGCV